MTKKTVSLTATALRRKLNAARKFLKIGERVIITNHGKEIATILSAADYERLVGRGRAKTSDVLTPKELWR